MGQSKQSQIWRSREQLDHERWEELQGRWEELQGGGASGGGASAIGLLTPPVAMSAMSAVTLTLIHSN